MTEPTPEQSGRKRESKRPEFSKVFAGSVRHRHERSLVGRLIMSAALAVTAIGVVVGIGALVNHPSDTQNKPVSAERPYQSRSPVTTGTARPTLSPHQPPPPYAAPQPTGSYARPAKPTTPGMRKKSRKHRATTFAGASDVLLKNTATRLCADLPEYGKGATNDPVTQYTCRAGSSDNQVWSLSAVEAKGPGGVRLFEIRNAKDGLCMDLPDYGAQPAGAKVSEYPCLSTTQGNDLWYVSSGAGGHYIRDFKSNGLCLGPTGGAGAGANARLEIHQCGSADTWTW